MIIAENQSVVFNKLSHRLDIHCNQRLKRAVAKSALSPNQTKIGNQTFRKIHGDAVGFL